MAETQPSVSGLGRVIHRRAVLRLLAACSLASLAGASGGCSLLGAMAYKFSGDPTVQAKHSPAKVPTVVICRRDENPSDVAVEADRISHLVSDDLATHGVGPMIDPATVPVIPQKTGGGSVWAAAKPPVGTAATRTSAATTRPAGGQLVPPAELGRAAGAKQVIYIDLQKFNMFPAIATELVRGEAAASVRILDADTGQTLWPLDTSQGYAVAASTPYVQPEQKLDEPGLREKMCQDLADQISHLFYTYKASQVDEGSNPH